MSGLESLTASNMGLSEAISVSGRRCMHTRLSLFRLHTSTAHVVFQRIVFFFLPSDRQRIDKFRCLNLLVGRQIDRLHPPRKH